MSYYKITRPNAQSAHQLHSHHSRNTVNIFPQKLLFNAFCHFFSLFYASIIFIFSFYQIQALGEVVAVGSNVKHLSVGQPVASMNLGTYSDYQVQGIQQFNMYSIAGFYCKKKRPIKAVPYWMRTTVLACHSGQKDELKR